MKKIIIGIIALVIIGGGFAYYKTSQGEVVSKEYQVFNVEKSTFEKIIEVDGVVEARDTKLIYVDRSLKVDEVFYTAGDYVKKGETIMTFDPEDKHTVIRNLKVEEINLKKFERNLKNAVSMFQIGGSTKVEIEDIEFDIEKSKLNIEGLQEESSKMLDEIKSPFDGTIISMVAEANYRVNTEVELFEIADLSDLIVVANVPEYSIHGILLGQDVKIRPDAYDDELHGIVSNISTLSSATESNSSNNSSTDTDTEAYVDVEITIDNLPKELRPGFNTSVDIIVNSIDDAISIPRSSILEDKKGYYVFVLNTEKNIRKNYVEIKENNSSMIIIANLPEGISILKNPFIALEENQEVKIGSRQGKGREAN
ncbi:efflux RND transporter periplasmic adaptor subunit [Psychrilyobacter sp.]|uniref:efflux RND transporter periplasmic adaptor subunit n=1 Tax=Psychrilyobacter sp. TaxID=2586924 RepID=UPI00301729A5